MSGYLCILMDIMISLGSDRNKSMGSTRFKEMLSNAVKNEKLKTSDFKKDFFNWMGDNEQIDDVLVMGFTL